MILKAIKYFLKMKAKGVNVISIFRIKGHGSLTVGYQKKVPAGRIKPAFFVSNFWFLSIVFYCNVL